MPFSAYSLLRFAGLLICLISGAMALARTWIRAAGGDLTEIFPSVFVTWLFGPLTHEALGHELINFVAFAGAV